MNTKTFEMKHCSKSEPHWEKKRKLTLQVTENNIFSQKIITRYDSLNSWKNTHHSRQDPTAFFWWTYFAECISGLLDLKVKVIIKKIRTRKKKKNKIYWKFWLTERSLSLTGTANHSWNNCTIKVTFCFLILHVVIAIKTGLTMLFFILHCLGKYE